MRNPESIDYVANRYMTHHDFSQIANIRLHDGENKISPFDIKEARFFFPDDVSESETLNLHLGFKDGSDCTVEIPIGALLLAYCEAIY